MIAATLLMVAQAAALPNCETIRDPIPADQCRLNQSMQLDPPPNCKDLTTQFDLNVCSFRDYLQADIELNRQWSAVEKRWKPWPDMWTVVLGGQRAWLGYRDKQCAFWSKMYEGGTIAALAVNSCSLEITKARTSELKQLLEND